MTNPDLGQRLLLASARLVRQARQSAPSGLTSSQASALGSLSRLGPIRVSDLAQVEAVALPVMTRLIGSLEELQLVVKVASAIDKRSVMVELTDAGRAKIVSLISEQSVVVSAKLEALTPEEINSLRGALEALEKLGSQNR